MSANWTYLNFGKEQLESATSVTATLAKNVQMIIAEATDASKKSIESYSAYIDEILGAKSLDQAIEIQSDYLKSAYETAVAEATKLSDLSTGFVKEAFKPFESAFGKLQPSAAVAIKPAVVAKTGKVA
ncbi:MAG TPA: phasin family protein [Methylovirgula sp.]|nr:phasin family protein [Methylovirgula sp.]